MSAVLWSYIFSTALVEPPAASRMLFDAGHPYTAATKAWLSQLRADGVNVKATLLQIPTGAVFHVQDHQYADRWVECLTAGAVIDKGAYVEIPIAWDSNGANLYNGNIVEVLFVTSIDLPTPSESVSLVTIDAAKRHLYVTDPAQDAAVIEKAEQASAIIVRHLDTQADPTWDDLTAPLPVQAAVLLMLGYLYAGNRGDAPGGTTIWQDVDHVLKQFRDPALA